MKKQSKRKARTWYMVVYHDCFYATFIYRKNAESYKNEHDGVSLQVIKVREVLPRGRK